MKTCKDFPEAPSCCITCHEDYDEFGYDLCDFYQDGVLVALVCCAVSNYLNDHGIFKNS